MCFTNLEKDKFEAYDLKTSTVLYFELLKLFATTEKI